VQRERERERERRKWRERKYGDDGYDDIAMVIIAFFRGKAKQIGQGKVKRIGARQSKQGRRAGFLNSSMST